VIRVTFSKKDHGRDVKRSISKTIFVTNSNPVSSALTRDTSDIQASIVSPSKSRVAVLRQTSEQDKKKRYVEIWAGDRLEASQEVSSTHGAFLTEGKFISAHLNALLIPTAQTLYHLSHSRHLRPHFCTVQRHMIPQSMMPARMLIHTNDFGICRNLGKVTRARKDPPFISFGGRPRPIPS